MKDPLSFYQQNSEMYTKQKAVLKMKIRRFSLYRLSLFMLILAVSYFLYDQTVLLAGVVGIMTLAYVLLVLHHQSLKRKKNYTAQLIRINELEINVLERRFHTLPSGAEYMDSHHYFSNDIDLFGKGSFFQYMNRTATRSGKDALATLLLSNNIDQIGEKQEVIRELSEKADWRQRFLALAGTVKTEMDIQLIIEWVHKHQSFLNPFIRSIPLVFAPLSIVLLLLTSLGVISFYVVLIWFFLGLFITMPFVQRINHLYLFSSQIKDTFKQFHPLLSEIEHLDVQSVLALRQKERIGTTDKSASSIFKEFSKILDAFDQRNNMLFGILGNGFFLWDLRQTSRIDSWVIAYRDQIDSWFEVISYFDSQISMANYHFNHPGHSFPSPGDPDTIVKARQLGHPLLDKNHRVNNDFQIKRKEFHIITGANMAGKSTFLRTVSLALVMANSGLPVCAEKMEYSPVKLITSMRTSDSLADESSYFYAEIMRLRFIVDQIKVDEYFIILDEILKGTNSRDKATGSKKFVKKLVGSNSTGMIATHDLSLCDIEKQHPQIQNKFFDAKIKNEELYFDYKLKEGICTNMNASFLLKKMDII